VANRGHTPLVHVYGASDVAGFFDVARLKESMAKALVPFYPLAGRLGVDSDGHFQINCNVERALFIVAHSDHTVEYFSGPSPSPELTKLFAPRAQPSSIRATLGDPPSSRSANHGYRSGWRRFARFERQSTE
jgi:shikimate O-hydroxycinnamoyltransferase